MKKVLLSLMAIAVALVSCKKEEQIVPEIKADKTEYQIPLAGTEETDFYVEFSTNVEWTAVAESEGDWCTISPRKGDAGDAKIKVVAEANTLKEERTAKIVVKAGTVEQTFTLVQSSIPFLDIEETSVELDVNGTAVTIPVKANVKFSVTAEDADWLKITTTESSITFSSVKNEDVDSRSADVVVAPENEVLESLEISVSQEGRLAVVWGKKPASDWADFVPAEGARMAAYGDYILLANGSRIFALNAADGTVAQKISLPDGMKAQSICVDEGGNVLFAANAAWAADETAEMFRIYTTKSLDQAPRLLVEYNSANIRCGAMCNVRVQGNIDANAVITAYASYSAYWMAWEVTGGKVGDLKCNTTPYTSNAFCGCVYPNGSTLADGLWFIGYGGSYNLEYCADVTANTWVDSYVTGSSWMENYDCISSVKVGDKKYIAISASCHFNYDSTNLIILDVTNPASAVEIVNYATDGFVSRGDDYANLDWTGAGTYADVCLLAKGENLYLYFIDVNYGAAGCIMLK